MKTNTKKVINIVLTLAMLFSLITAFGGVSLAAAEISEVSAAHDDGVVSVEYNLAGADKVVWASLRAAKVVGGDLVYLDQYDLENGEENDVEFAIDNVALKGLVLKVFVASAAGSADALVAIDVEKDELDAEIAISPIDRPQEFSVSAQVWGDYVEAYDAAVAASEYPFSSQLEVDAALEDLQDAHDTLAKKITSVGFPDNVPAMVTLARGQSYTFQAIFDSAFEGNFAIATDFEWSLLVPGFAAIDAVSGKVIAGTKAGTVPLQVKDKITGLTAQIVLRIV
ncbi:MAG: Ig-like domain-containing protein [Oscillospiraceae bacterium]|nr:Ig-like domain-containing protein [Oscillospiraceae bacterium]